MLMLDVAPFAGTPLAPAVGDPEVSEITQLEQQWGQAFVSRDFAFIERIVAPEYRLVVASPDGKYAITGRAEWMKNGQALKSHAFAVETVDVNRVGDTAVAPAHGAER